MHKTIFAAAVATLVAGPALAQFSFDGAEVSVISTSPINHILGDVTKFDLEAKLGFSVGMVGIQADLGYNTLADPSGRNPTYGITDLGIHAYYRFGDTLRTGVYYSSENPQFAFAEPFESYGLEAMASLGRLDIELAYGEIAGNTPSGLSDFAASVSYALTDSFSVNAGLRAISNKLVANNTIYFSAVGASYRLSNIPLSIGASYTTGYENDFAPQTSAVNIKVSYAFGGGTQDGWQPYSARNLDYFNLILLASGN